MKLVRCKVVSVVLSDAGNKKMEQGNKYDPNQKDHNNLSLEQYEDLKMPIPEDSIHFNKNSETDEIILEDSDLEVVFQETYFNLDEFAFVSADSVNGGSTVYLKGGSYLEVKESAQTIKNRIDKLINN